MEAVLIDIWLDGLDATRTIDEASASEARRLAREVARAQGFDDLRRERLALVASELAMNQLRHARQGRFAARPIARAGVAGVELVFADAGAGLSDPAAALRGAARSSGSLGVGVASARDHADEMDFDVRLREGTCIRARMFASPVPRRREIGIYGRPHEGEPKSGDHALFLREGDALVVAMCDALGHGPAANEAAQIAIATVVEHRREPPRTIMEACHRSMAGSRGAVLDVLRIDESRSTDTTSSPFELASVGNISVEVARGRDSRRYGATSFVVGAPQKGWRLHAESSRLEAADVLVVSTDGIPSRVTLAGDPALLVEPPIVIAQRLVEEHGRATDDVLVLVAR